MSKYGNNIRKCRDGRWEGRYIKARTDECKPVLGYIYGTSYKEVHKNQIPKKAEANFFQLSGKKVLFSELSLQKPGTPSSQLHHRLKS